MQRVINTRLEGAWWRCLIQLLASRQDQIQLKYFWQMFIQSIHRNVSDGYCTMSQDKLFSRKRTKSQNSACVLGLEAKWQLFESFFILALTLIYINIHIIHRVLKLCVLLAVLAVGTVRWLVMYTVNWFSDSRVYEI